MNSEKKFTHIKSMKQILKNLNRLKVFRDFLIMEKKNPGKKCFTIDELSNMRKEKLRLNRISFNEKL